MSSKYNISSEYFSTTTFYAHQTDLNKLKYLAKMLALCPELTVQVGYGFHRLLSRLDDRMFSDAEISELEADYWAFEALLQMRKIRELDDDRYCAAVILGRAVQF